MKRSQTNYCKSHLTIFLILLCLCYTQIALAKSVIDVKVGIFANKPMCYYDDTGQPAGIFVSVIEYTAKQEGWNLVYVKDSFANLREKLANGKIDILLSTAVSEERKKLYDYNETDVFSNWAEVYVLPEAKINSLLDLRGKRIATLAKGIYSLGPEGIIRLNEIFDLECKFVFVNKYKDGLASVSSNVTDAAVVSRLVGTAYANDYGLVQSGIVFAPVRMRFAFNKENHNTPLFVAALDKHLKSLIKDEKSVYQRAISEALGGTEITGLQKIPKYCWIFISFALLFIVLLVGFTQFLLGQIKIKTEDLCLSNNQLLDSDQKYRRLLESTSIVLWELDFNSQKFTYMGKQIERILGYPSDSWKDLTVWADRIHQEDREEALRLCETETAKGKDHDFVYRAIHNDGSFRWIRDIVSVIGEAGKPQRLVGFMHDITEQKVLSLENEKLEYRLQQAQKLEAIGTLAGGIAHDFNNILGAIIGYTELAQDDSSKGTSISKDLKRVLDASHRAKGLVAQILAFSRQTTSESISLQPGSIVKEVLKMLRPSLPATIQIKQNIDSQAGLVCADPTKIHQIIMNLCTNAFHAMEEKGGVLEVILKGVELHSEDLVLENNVEAGSFIQLSVGDSGAGIAPGVKDKIFEPFFTTKGVGKGTGMGLSTVYGIAKSYGGFVTVDSEPAEGTVFHVYLPLSSNESQIQERVSKPVPRGQERVLLVDDEDLLVEMGSEMIQRLGYNVTAKNSSLAALEIFRNQPDQFDVVITDQTMPGMNGIDLARRMLQIRPDIPIILCTGYSSMITEEKVKSVGIKEFAFKPLTKRDIAKLIRKVL